MDAVWIVLGWLCLAVGAVGCFVPVIPGPPVAYLALFAACAAGKGLSVVALAVAGGLTALVTVLDYVVPALGARKFHCSRLGTVGCIVGTFVGLFFLPLGVVLGPFLGALVGELVAHRPFDDALRGAVGALLGYLAGILLKLACCVYLGFVFARAVCG